MQMDYLQMIENNLI